jgi:sarcosine dehydrogenase
MASLSDHEIIVIGGGIVGCSIAYWLTKMGKTDVAVLEKSGVTHGSTWHAAGNIGLLRTSANLSRIARMSVELYGRLEEETGLNPEWRPVGCLRIAGSEARMMELRAQLTAARTFGLDVELVGPDEACELYPLMSPEGVVGGIFCPSEGYAEPASLTQAIARGARMGGAVIHEGVRVTGLTTRDGRITEVVTDQGSVRAEVVVNAGGNWAGEIAALAGLNVPTCALENQYIITEPYADMPKDLPVLRDNDSFLYARPEVGGLLVGAVDSVNPPFGRDGIPPDFGRELLPENWDRWSESVEPLVRRLPFLNEVGIRSLINGPLPTTPDVEPILGFAPGIENFFLACGVTAGIGQGGGLGRVVAEWLVEGRPSLDLWRFDMHRFAPTHYARDFVYDSAQYGMGHHYGIHYPGEERGLDVGARTGPLHGALAARGAVWGTSFGWTRPNWFAPEGVAPVDEASYGWPNWFEFVAAEHCAALKTGGLVDLTSQSRFDVSGPGALSFLQTFATADLDLPAGAITRSPFCNETGGIEAELLVARIAPDRFILIGGASTTARDFAWLEGHADGHDVALRDASIGRAAIGLIGPAGSELLSRISDLAEGDWPDHTAREIELGYASALALRHGGFGLPAIELHCAAECARYVYDRLRDAGDDLGIVDVGHRALDSLRIEAGIPRWGADINTDVTPHDCGLAVALDKGEFLGREALAQIAKDGPKWALRRFTLDEKTSVFGGEAVVADGDVVGSISSATFGHAIGRPVLLGYLPPDIAARDGVVYEIEAFAERHPARLEPGA